MLYFGYLEIIKLWCGYSCKYNQHCFGYIQLTTLNNKNTFGAPYSSNVIKEAVEENRDYDD